MKACDPNCPNCGGRGFMVVYNDFREALDLPCLLCNMLGPIL